MGQSWRLQRPNCIPRKSGKLICIGGDIDSWWRVSRDHHRNLYTILIFGIGGWDAEKSPIGWADHMHILSLDANWWHSMRAIEMLASAHSQSLCKYLLLPLLSLEHIRDLTIAERIDEKLMILPCPITVRMRKFHEDALELLSIISNHLINSFLRWERHQRFLTFVNPKAWELKNITNSVPSIKPDE